MARPEAIDATILHPGRTLLEKLLRINNFAQTQSSSAHGWPRIGRQFYDIWTLLGDQQVLDFLADHDSAALVLADCQSVSASIDKPDRPPPAGGFAACPAFSKDGPLSVQLQRAHDEAMSVFYYGPDNGPSFIDVLERVADNASRLDLA